MDTQQTQPLFTFDRLVKIQEAASILTCHECTIRRWIGRGTLPAYRRGRLIRVRLFDLARILAQPGMEEQTEKLYSASDSGSRTSGGS